MTSRRLGLLALLAVLASPASASSIGECAGGTCPARDSLKALSDTSPGAYGHVYDRSLSLAPGADGVTAEAGAKKPVRLSPPAPSAPRRAAPDLAVKPEEKEESGGFGGFLNKHKWQIGGALAGGLLTLFMGGGLFGILAGIAVSLAVSYLGPKIFPNKK